MEYTLIKSVLDRIDEGVIVVDGDKIIQYINKSALKIFGIDLRDGQEHPEGIVKPGDIIIVACNKIGLSESVLLNDLELIGIDINEVKKGDAIVAIGELGALKGSALKKTKAISYDDRVLELKCLYKNNIPVKVVVNEINNQLSIAVNEICYKMHFQQYDNNLVVIDPITYQVKFYQSRGYTLRGESPNYVLRGRHYVAKGCYAKAPAVEGTHISVLKPNSLVVDSLRQVLSGECDKIKGREYPFNDIYVRLSVYPNRIDGVIKGCILIFSDISDIKKLQQRVDANEFKKNVFGHLVGNSQVMCEAKDMAYKVSLSNSTVLLSGESGTGKGVFAQAIHESSKRAGKPFIQVNMAAIPGTLLESELFGYVEGAFTGARKNGKMGKFQMADGGTVFLDEIGDLEPQLQAKLLQVLQEKFVYPVGSVKPIEVDVRVIAATHRNLEEEIKKGAFREDLYYRLNVINLEIPSLRSRKEDIRDLVSHMLPRLNSKVGKKIENIDEDVYNLLLTYDWPGNVRELENVLESSINLAEGTKITLKDLPRRFMITIRSSQNSTDGLLSLKSASSMAEKEAIELALSITKGNRTEAAHLLKIGRTAFYNKLRKYNLNER